MDKHGTPGKYFDFVTKEIDCTKIFSKIHYPVRIIPPPKHSPAEWRANYSMDGKVRLSAGNYHSTVVTGKEKKGEGKVNVRLARV